jgi:hypothetical protein
MLGNDPHHDRLAWRLSAQLSETLGVKSDRCERGICVDQGGSSIAAMIVGVRTVSCQNLTARSSTELTHNFGNFLLTEPKPSGELRQIRALRLTINGNREHCCGVSLSSILVRSFGKQLRQATGRGELAAKCEQIFRWQLRIARSSNDLRALAIIQLSIGMGCGDHAA